MIVAPSSVAHCFRSRLPVGRW